MKPTIDMTDEELKAIFEDESRTDAERPWLHEPTGWELDVTAEEVAGAYKANVGGDGLMYGGVCAILHLCRSRIRPTFECAECAKVKAERDAFCRSWDDCRNRLCVIRNLCDQAALEGE